MTTRKVSGRSEASQVLSFTKLEIPELEVFETAVAFDADCDPLSAHDELCAVFGQRAGQGKFLFGADSTLRGRYWVRSAVPWLRRPERAVSALEPKRVVIQLASGLMYHFTLSVCVGREHFETGQKHVQPYETTKEFEAWFNDNAAEFGVKPLMFSAALQTLRFRYREGGVRIEHALLEGALEVADAERLKRQLLYGLGSHRRAGLGLLRLTN
jgi:CRISPR-associated protein Cas6/Cse3/CasE subtype I-E